MRNEIITTSNFNEIKVKLLEGDAKSLTLLDVDDTIITPKSNMFRSNSKFYRLIDDLKKTLKDEPENLQKILAWRLNRKLMLVNNNWPELIREKKFNKHNIYALTQMNSGSFGSIKSMQDWRYNELKSMGVTFSEEFCGKNDIEILPEIAFKEYSGILSSAVFYKGFFMTGGHSKGAVLRYILEEHFPSKIFFVDDREDHVKDVGRVAEEFGIPYFGAVFRAIDLIDSRGSEEVMDLQKKMLLEEVRWIEDDKAEEMIRNGW